MWCGWLLAKKKICHNDFNSMIEFKGAKWQKCDLHLHTPASQCFRDRNVTAEQWVDRCLEQQLDCVAVTDHNTGAWVDKIK